MSPYTLPIFSTGAIHYFNMFQDNYGYLITDGKSNRAATVDPGDGEAVLSWAEKLGLELTTIICTHKHSDHVGGNLYIKNLLPSVEIIGPGYEEIPGLTKPVMDGDSFLFESLKFSTIHTPCHTSGHVLYFVEEVDASEPQKPILFSGDTLFVGGCGRFFEGTAAQMQDNMERISSLPHETLVFCAHEYTLSNYRFLANIDPDTCSNKLASIELQRSQNLPTIPSDIATELNYNLFMKCHDPDLQTRLGVSSAIDAMGKLRSLKNDFR